MTTLFKKTLHLMIRVSLLTSLAGCTGFAEKPNMVDYSYIPTHATHSVPGIEEYD